MLRWVILLSGTLALVAAYRGLDGKRPYAESRRAGVVFMGSLHLQLLFGLALFFTSTRVARAMSQIKLTMADPPTRFFIAEHPTMMIAAVVLATFGLIFAKRGPDDAAKHRRALVFIGATLALILAAIPWGRPLF